MLEEISTQLGYRHWSKLEGPGVNLRSSPAGERKRDDLGSSADHQCPICGKKSNPVELLRLWAQEHGNKGTGVDQKLTVSQENRRE